MANRLKVSEQRFLEEFAANSFKLSIAFARAGIHVSSPKAHLNKLLKNPAFKAAYEEKIAQAKFEEEVKKEIVVGEIATMAFADIRDYYDASGRLIPLHELPAHAAKAIVGVKTVKLKDRYGNERSEIDAYEIADKLGALQLLGRTVDLQLFKDTRDVNITTELTDRPTVEIAARLIELLGSERGGKTIEGSAQEVTNREAAHVLSVAGPVST